MKRYLAALSIFLVFAVAAEAGKATVTIHSKKMEKGLYKVVIKGDLKLAKGENWEGLKVFFKNLIDQEEVPVSMVRLTRPELLKDETYKDGAYECFQLLPLEGMWEIRVTINYNDGDGGEIRRTVVRAVPLP